MKRHLLFGFGQDTKRYLDTFMNLDKHIDGIVDSNTGEGDYFGIPINRYLEMNNDDTIIISSNRFFGEMYKELIHKYQIDKNNIISAHEWICQLLKGGEVFLRPTKVRLDISTLCQLDCAYCYMRTGNYGTTGRGYITAETYESFLNKNPFVREIELSNSGEVFLNPDFSKILRISKQRGVMCTIGNGTNFNTVSEEQLELLVDLPVRFINFSIDGASQETYSIYRRGGDFNRVINNIKRLNEIKKKNNSIYPILQWQFIMMPHNESDAGRARKMAEDLGMQIFFKPDWIREDYEPAGRDMMEEITGLDYFNRLEYNKKYDKKLGMEMCYQMIYQPQINWDGRLLGCCMVWNDDFGVNVFDIGLVEALKSKRYRETVETLLGLRDKNDCENCMCKNCVVYENVENRNFLYL